MANSAFNLNQALEADTVDGFNASSTPTANTILPLNANGVFPGSVLGLAWTSYTPTLSGRFDNAKWNKNCSYVQIGKTVIVKIHLAANTTTPMSGSGDPIFTLPVTSISYQSATILNSNYIEDLATAGYVGVFRWRSTTTADFAIINASGTYAATTAVTNAIPMTWTTGDLVTGIFVYEVA